MIVMAENLHAKGKACVCMNIEESSDCYVVDCCSFLRVMNQHDCEVNTCLALPQSPRATSRPVRQLHAHNTPAKPSTAPLPNPFTSPDRIEAQPRWRRIAMCAICWGCLLARWHPRRRARSRRRADRQNEYVRMLRTGADAIIESRLQLTCVCRGCCARSRGAVW